MYGFQTSMTVKKIPVKMKALVKIKSMDLIVTVWQDIQAKNVKQVEVILLGMSLLVQSWI